ncbi:MAG: hypothetical protein U5N85_17660 [Arcicella sp.]|nr:hypothetical protein [Arcicella sp.]
MDKHKIIEFLKLSILTIFLIYFIDWFMVVGYKLLKGANFATLNSQYYFKWTWVGVAVGISYYRVYRKKA